MARRRLTVVETRSQAAALGRERAQQFLVCDASDIVTMADFRRMFQTHQAAAVSAPVTAAMVLLQAKRSRLFAGETLGPRWAFRFLRQVGVFIAHEVTPATLKQRSSRVDTFNGARSLDFAKLWHSVETMLEAQNRVACWQASPVGHHPAPLENLPHFERVDFRFVSQLDAADRALIAALATPSGRVANTAFEPPTVCVHWTSFGVPALDASQTQFVAQLEKRSELETLELEQHSATGAFVEAAAVACGFSNAAKPLPALFTTHSTHHEATEVARRIRALLDLGVPSSSIAVVVPEDAANLLTLFEAWAPLSLAPIAALQLRLKDTHTFAALGQFVELVRRDFPAAPTARFLASPLFAERGFADVLPLFRAAGIVDNRRGATGTTGAYALRLSALAASLVSRDEQTASLVKRLQAALTPLFHLATRLKKATDLGQQLALLEQLLALVAAKPATNSEQRNDQFEDNSATAFSSALARARAQVSLRLAVERASLRQLKSAMPPLVQATADLDGDRHFVALGEWLDCLSHETLDHDLAFTTPGIQVLRANETPGRSFDHVFVVGCTLARFGERSAEAPLLDNQTLRELNSAGRTALVPTAVVDHETFVDPTIAARHFEVASVFSMAEQTLTLSWPQFEAGVESTPSPFLQRLLQSDGAPATPLISASVSAAQAHTESDLRLAAASLKSTTGAVNVSVLAEPWAKALERQHDIVNSRRRFFAEFSSPPDAFSGQLPKALAKAAFTFGPQRPLSASVLGHYGACGFRGFAGDLLRLRRPEARGEEMLRQERGTFLHRVAARAIATLRDAQALEQATPDIVKSAVEQAVAEIARGYHGSLSTGHPALWALELARTATRVLAVLTDSVGEGQAMPAHEELAFGPTTELKVVLPSGGDHETELHFRGTIDRVDLSATTLRVVDYKTNAAPFRSAAKKTLLVSDFQLPLYLYAATRAYSRPVLQAAWWGFQDRAEVRLEQVLGQGDAFTALLADDPATRADCQQRGVSNFANAVHALVEKLQSGEVTPRPAANACETCDFGAVCRIAASKRLELT